MAKVLILYATSEGHTARIAERIAQGLRDKGHCVASQRVDASGTIPDLESYQGVIVGAPVHYGRHPSHLRTLLREHRAALAARSSAFFSVSLSAGGPGAKPAAARRYVQTFLRQAGWQPQQASAFGGVLQFSKYGRLKRLLMILFVGLAGGDTDTSRDYEYTDWDAVERFTGAFTEFLKFEPMQAYVGESRGV